MNKMNGLYKIITGAAMVGTLSGCGRRPIKAPEPIVMTEEAEKEREVSGLVMLVTYEKKMKRDLTVMFGGETYEYVHLSADDPANNGIYVRRITTTPAKEGSEVRMKVVGNKIVDLYSVKE